MIRSLGERTPVLVGRNHFVADNATVIGDVRIEDEASIWFDCVVRGDNDRIVIGAGSNVQDACVLHTDPGYALTIGRGVTVGHKAMLHGCTIGNNTLVGINSVVLNGARIGKDCILAAGSLVAENKTFPDGSLILGSPAKVVRDLTAEEIAQNAESAQRYIENATRYRACFSAAE